METSYKYTKEDIKPDDVSRVFSNSGIKRPYQDLDRLDRMIKNADIVISAWMNGQMIGIARALTDFSYCCYLSDLAVDKEHQQSGIGKELIDKVREAIGEECSLVLISSPVAVEYYPKVGFTKTDKAFVIGRSR